MNTAELAEKSLPTINELLQSCSAFPAAYCLGVISALAWQDWLEPPRTLLELAAKCPSIEQAVALYVEFKALRTRRG